MRDRVVQQGRDRPPQGHRVALHDHLTGQVGLQPDPLICRVRTGAVRQLFDQRAHGNRLPVRRPSGLRCDQQVVDDGDHARGVPYHSLTVSQQLRRRTRQPQRPGQQLGAGGQQGQRGTQLVAGVGDEVSLHSKGLRQRAYGPTAHQQADRTGTEQTHDAGPEQGLDQTPALGMLQRQVERDLHHSGAPQLGANPELAAVTVHVGDHRTTCAGNPLQRHRVGQRRRDAGRRGGGASSAADDDPRAGRRIAHVVGIDRGLAQLGVGLRVLLVQRHQHGERGQRHHDQPHERRALQRDAPSRRPDQPLVAGGESAAHVEPSW